MFLGNIKILLINNLETSLSTYLINELIKFKICILICNESKYPYNQIIPIYGTYDCSYKLETQILWDPYIKENLWIEILKQKINNQTKIRLINTLYQNCLIVNIQTQLYLAIPMYLKSIFNYLEDKTDKIKEITFEN